MSDLTPPTDVTSDDKLWAMLAYLLSPIVPIIVLVMEDKKNRPFIKAHNVQALVFGAIAYILSTILSFVAGLGCIIWIVYLVFAILWGVKANKGEYVTIPVITDWVKSQGWA